RTGKEQRQPGPRARYCNLKRLLEAGMLTAGARAYTDYEGVRYQAVIQADGKMLFEGKAYASPSSAGGAVTRKHNVSSPHGWTFWHVTDAAGNEVLLDALRQQWRAQQEGTKD
ncbi:unnamed protein product, partial [marine sediment metagenome]